MCLIAWNWQPGSATPLLMVANRDEFYTRPSAPLGWWPGNTVLAGKDLEGGGTWLGVNRKGWVAALTNYRTMNAPRTDAPSRGALVADFLTGEHNAEAYLAQLSKHSDNYNPFNLLVFDGHSLLGLESRDSVVRAMPHGIGGVSNADFHTPWPKLTALQQGLGRNMALEQTDTSTLLSLLRDRKIADDALLPQTGIGLERERLLSAAFIASPLYGTRACSIVRVQRGHISFAEHSYDFTGPTGAQQYAFDLPDAKAPAALGHLG